MSSRSKPLLPPHVEGLLSFLAKPHEKANEDLAISYFRAISPKTFVRQASATGADGYVPGHFVLELKGRTGSWFAGLCQGLAYTRDLDCSTIVVAAKEFLAIWRIEDLPDSLRSDILTAEGAASSVGRRFATKYRSQQKKILRSAIWRGEVFVDLFASEPRIVLSHLAAFEQTLQQAKKVRRSITLRNFTTVLKEMVPFFNPANPLSAVNAFYSMVYAWDDKSVLQISERTADQAALGGEIIKDLIPGQRAHFKAFVESCAVRLAKSGSTDEFFAQYDKALDAVDSEYRVRHGIFFTDLDLSKFALWLVKKSIPDLGKNYLIIDPACGSGNLVTNWRSPLNLRHKVVSEIAPDLLYVVERRMKGDQWHNGKFTVVPKTSEGRGLNFLEHSASEYLAEITRYIKDKGHRPDRPLAFLCNPPYRSDDDQTATPITYDVHPSIIDIAGKDASAERYCCFLAQMSAICREAVDSGLPDNSVLMVFTKPGWLTDRPMFAQLRQFMLGQFEDCGGFIVNGKQFFDVRGKFPIAFTIWRYVGKSRAANPNRPISVVDLTHLAKADLAGIPWGDPNVVESSCEQLWSSGKRVSLGVSRTPLKSWVGQSMTDFKRGRRKAERGVANAGGLPAGDRRSVNKKVYGEQMGTSIGFMDDLTPCRTAKPTLHAPHFRLDPRFMRVRDARCFSGHGDHYSYAPENTVSAKRLSFWYAMARTFAEHGYPMWADASEIWSPSTDYEPDSVATAYALAITLAENECVEAVFPSNNPVEGAPEVACSNPLAPLDPESYWTTHFAGAAREARVLQADILISAVERLYRLWASRFSNHPELHVPYRRAYFIGDGVLTRSAGIVQIRDFAVETDDADLLEALREIRQRLRQAKDAFMKYVTSEEGLDYFGTPRAPRSETFAVVVERRVALGALIVDALAADPHLGRTKLAKVLYLADVSQDLQLRMKYRREAAGPLDPRALYNAKTGIEAIAESRGYFAGVQKGSSVRYEVGASLRDVIDRGSSLFGDKLTGIHRVIEQCRSLSTDQVEIVATLYACWNDLLLSRKATSDEVILSEFLTKWHDKKKRFAKVRLMKALAWMRAQQLIPQGRGARTERSGKAGAA